MKNFFFQFLVLIGCICCCNSALFAQGQCDNVTPSAGTVTVPATLCSDGSDAITINAQDNGNLGSYAVAIEIPDGLGGTSLVLVESPSPTESFTIDPVALGLTTCNVVRVGGIAYDIQVINDLIGTLSGGCGFTICNLAIGANLPCETCEAIDDLFNAGGINNLADGIAFAGTLGADAPTSIDEALTLLGELDAQAADLGGICYATSPIEDIDIVCCETASATAIGDLCYTATVDLCVDISNGDADGLTLVISGDAIASQAGAAGATQICATVAVTDPGCNPAAYSYNWEVACCGTLPPVGAGSFTGAVYPDSNNFSYTLVAAADCGIAPTITNTGICDYTIIENHVLPLDPECGQTAADGSYEFSLELGYTVPAGLTCSANPIEVGAIPGCTDTTPNDCEGTCGGTALEGTACDDGDPATGGDTWQADCTCAGSTVDCEGTPGGTATPGTACDDGDATTGNDVYQADCSCAGEAIDCEGTPGGTAIVGSGCDDGDATTGNDVWQADCSCAGEALDCEGTPGGTATVGSACDDGDAATSNDVWQADCSCAGTVTAVDCEGVPNGPATVGSACDDGDATTGNDVYQADCTCAGEAIDCEGTPGGTAVVGSACDDGDPATGGDVYQADCSCAGSTVDCEGTPGGSATPGTACDDGDAGTINDVYQADCSCAGSAPTCDDAAACNTGDPSPCQYLDCAGVCGGTASAGDPCDDGDPLTMNDVYQADCSCAGMAAPIEASIEDPCSCGDPNNIDTNGDLIIEFFYETVVITSGPGETWTYTAAGSNNVLDAGGAPTTPTFTEAPAGTYTTNFYHPAGVGYTANFTNGVDPQTISNSCDADCNIDVADVPTMGQWGLIILSLLTLNFLFLTVMTAKVQGPRGASATVNLFSWTRIRNYPFNRELFKHAAMITALFLLAITGWTLSVYGFLAMTDIIGSAIAAPVFAYLLHLVAMMNQKDA